MTIKTKTIISPTGEPFKIPALTEFNAKHAEKLTHDVWAGEYDHPKLPTSGINSLLDIGCSWGPFIAWAKAKWPCLNSDLITGFDPHEEAISICRSNLEACELVCEAVTIEPGPVEHHRYDDWGTSSTHYKTNGYGSGYTVLVDTRHPADLPPAHLLKIDAEGVEAEIVENYRYLSTVKVLLVEFHEAALRDRIRAVCGTAGLTCLKEEDKSQGIAIWIKEEPHEGV
jgi:FkbM family methyltransferase